MAVIRNVRGGSAKWNEDDRLQLANLLVKAGYRVKIISRCREMRRIAKNT